ncbi:ABC transporter permease subunit, partial [Acinetobacter baumannii]
ESVDPRIEEAASTLGASPVAGFVTVTLPLMAPGILAGSVLACARAIGEFGATITFVSNIPGQTQTLATAIYTLIQTPGDDPAALRLIV